jgi:predicted Zn finger-like uncharacterized protein
MRLTCPNCAASYEIKAEALGPSGRTVRCASCGTKWFAAPEAAAASPPEALAPAAVEPPPAPETMAEAAQPDIGAGPSAEAIVAAVKAAAPRGESVEAAARRRQRPKKLSRRRAIGEFLTPRGIGWAVVASVALLCGGAFLARDHVVAAIPGTAGLFALVGHPVNLFGLEIEDVAIRVEFDGTQPVLIVEGAVRNVATSPLSVPRLRFAVRDATGTELASWPDSVARATISPGERLPFRSRLTSAPRNGNDIEVRFLESREARVGAL